MMPHPSPCHFDRREKSPRRSAVPSVKTAVAIAKGSADRRRLVIGGKSNRGGLERKRASRADFSLRSK
jgi:hypothetical protein